MLSFTQIVNVNHRKKLVLQSQGNDAVAIKLYWKGIEGFEPETFKIFRKLLKQSRVLFDIGANIGIYALVAAIDNPSIRVFAFEV